MQLGSIFLLQGAVPLDRDINTIQIYYQLGVRVIQLTYNLKDFVGDGCEERHVGDGLLHDRAGRDHAWESHDERDVN